MFWAACQRYGANPIAGASPRPRDILTQKKLFQVLLKHAVQAEKPMTADEEAALRILLGVNFASMPERTSFLLSKNICGELAKGQGGGEPQVPKSTSHFYLREYLHYSITN